MHSLRKFVPFAKVEAAKREVWGIVTAEVPDKDGEICDYAKSKPHYQAWSAEFNKATGGESLGNLRYMHQLDAVGKVIGLDFRDDAKEIFLGAKVVDDAAWRKVEEGVLTGFSQGGEYVSGPDDDGRYVAKPSEVSLVDNPCLGVAHFAYVKGDGSVEMRKLASIEKAERRTKRVAGEDLPASAFAYVGDPDETDTWKLPIKFSTDEKTESHIRNALARFSQTEGIPAGEREKVHSRIVAAAKRHGIDVADEEKAAAILGLRKSLSEVSSVAGALECLACAQRTLEAEREIEGDNSKIPDALQAVIRRLGAILTSMTEEETSELNPKESKKMAESYGLSKRASLKEHVEKLHKAHREHHEEMEAHFAKLHKALADAGDEDEDDDKDDDEKARKRERKAAGVSREEVTEIIAEAFAKAQGREVKSVLVGRDGNPVAVPPEFAHLVTVEHREQ